MRDSYVYGILDHDAKGIDRGTVFYLKAVVDNVEYYREWSIFDETNNTPVFKDVCAIRLQYLTSRERKERERDQSLQDKKEQAMQARLESASVSVEVDTVIEQAIQDNPQLVEQIKSGAEKAINALVGRILGKLKSANLHANPFDISVVLKEKLAK